MPKLTVNGTTQEFPEGTRLVNAIEALGVNIGHRCGGKARCTTCRCEVEAGEPDTMTRAEFEKLSDKGLLGESRLSCQILLENDMTVTPAMTRESEGWPDSGPVPADTIEPSPERFPKDELMMAGATD